MVSNKSTLGEYNADIDGNAQKFYNNVLNIFSKAFAPI